MVTLSPSAAFVSVPAQITVPAGALGVDVPVVAANEGSATVSASLNGSSASASVQVTPAQVHSLSVSPPDATAFVGDTVQYSASATLTDGSVRDETTRATWASSNPGAASINSSGTAQALAAGSTTVSAVISSPDGTVTATTPLTVLPTPVLTLTPASASLAVGASQVFTITTSAAAETDGLLITLAGSGTGSVSLPPSVTLAAGQSSTSFSVSATGAGSVLLSASAPRRTPTSATLTIGSGLSIASVAPSTGPVGSHVTLSGAGFDPVAANDRVAFSGATSAGVVATVVSASATQLVVSVPAGAQSGPITVTTPRGSAASPAFTVQGEQDFSVAASPAESVLIAGTSTTLAVQPTSTGTKPYTGLLDLAVLNLPAGVSAKLQPATLSTSQAGSIVFSATSSAVPGRYDVLVQASGLTSAGRQIKSASATLVVQGTSGATGVKGRFITPDGRPVAGVLVRVDAIQTATDAAGNFLLTGLPAGAVTLRFDATPGAPAVPDLAVQHDACQRPDRRARGLDHQPAARRRELRCDRQRHAGAKDHRRALSRGLALTLPAGVSIIGWDGVPKTRIADRAHRARQAARAARRPCRSRRLAAVLRHPDGRHSEPTDPGELAQRHRPGARPEDRDLVLRRQPDGRQRASGSSRGWAPSARTARRVVSDPGVGIPRFCGVCGLLSRAARRCPHGSPASPDSDCNKAGNPVELYSGQEMPNQRGPACNGLMPSTPA